MKPPNYKKVSHYDSMQPWDKQKPVTPKVFVKKEKKKLAKDFPKPYQAQTSLYAQFYGSGYHKFMTYPLGHDEPEEEPITIYKARALTPNGLIVAGEVKLTEGTEVVIHEYKVKPPNERWLYFVHCFNEPQPTLRDQVKEFLAQPKPTFESSLILPEEFVRQQEADLHVDRITEFIEQQIERKCEPLSELNQQYETMLLARDSTNISLRKQVDSLNETIAALQQQVAQLQARRIVVESRTVTASSYRRFRVED